MKKIVLPILLLILSNYNYAQKWEAIAKLNSGLFHFDGPGSNQEGNAYNAYGSYPGLSYGVGVNFQRNNAHHIQYGLNIDIESLESRAPFNYQDMNDISWTGRILLRHTFFTLSPHLDYIIQVKSILLNLSGGLDCALNLGKAQENYKSTSSDGQKISYHDERSTTAFDLRPSVQLAIFKKKIGMSVGYSAGIMDYKIGWVGGQNLVFSRYVKIGLQYRLNK